MAGKIRIVAGLVEAFAELNDTDTARAIWNALPVESHANRWGDEVYFSIPLALGQGKGQEVVELGDLGYWEPGRAFCIFFGKTPASRAEEIRPASPVTVFGRLTSNPLELRKVAKGTRITVEKYGSTKGGGEP